MVKLENFNEPQEKRYFGINNMICNKEMECKVMNEKRYFKLICCFVMLCTMLVMTACSNTNSEKDNNKKNSTLDSEQGFGEENSNKHDDENTEDDKENNEEKDSEEKVDEDEGEDGVTIIDALPYSDGYAWIKLSDSSNWKCIDKNGKVVFEKECESVSEFDRGYAVINNQVLINNKGDEIYNWGEKGYELFDKSPLDVNCVVLRKSNDKSDEPKLYFLDIENDKITELDFSDCSLFTDSVEWGNNYREWGSKATVRDYLGNGYYAIGFVGDDYACNYGTIQWYDIKNNEYVNIDTGVKYSDDKFPNPALYFKTSNPNEYCVYVVYLERMYFVNIETRKIVKTIDGWIGSEGDSLNIVDAYPGEYLIKYFDKNDVGYFLDVNTKETFQLELNYEKCKVLSYDGKYICVTFLVDDKWYLEVLDKDGNIVYNQVEYDADVRFKPYFLGDYLIFYYENIMYFVNKADWKIENQVGMSHEGMRSDENINERMYIKDKDSPDINYFVDNITYSYYLPSGEKIEILEGKCPVMLSSGMFEGKLLVKDDEKGCYEYYNNDLSKLKITY